MPGKTLPPDVLDSNNACIAFLHQAADAAELKAKIAEDDKRATGGKPKTQGGDASAPWFDSAKWEAAMTRLQQAQDQARQSARNDSLPRWDSIFVDRGSASAILVFPDGTTQTVSKGTVLPDGSTVSSIRKSTVTIHAASGETKTLLPATGDFGETKAITTSRQAPAPILPYGMPGQTQSPYPTSPPLLPNLPALANSGRAQ
nr:type IV pilus biogenesis protein PilP [Acetobacter garciniae]